MWRKLKPGLSAGRVQSVAVKLIVSREREINDFKPQEYRNIVADLIYKKDILTIACQSFEKVTKTRKSKKTDEEKLKVGKFTASQIETIIGQLALQTTSQVDTKT